MLSIIWSFLPDNDWWALLIHPVFLCKLNPVKACPGKGWGTVTQSGCAVPFSPDLLQSVWICSSHPQHTDPAGQSPHQPTAAPLYFPESHRWSEISSLLKVIEFGENPEVTGRQIWAVVELSYLGNLMFCQKTLHEMWYISWHVVVTKLPVTSCP